MYRPATIIAAITLAAYPASTSALEAIICREFAIAARSTMEGRQQGLPISTPMTIADKQRGPIADLLRTMIKSAYDRPVVIDHAGRQSAIRIFELEQQVACRDHPY